MTYDVIPFRRWHLALADLDACNALPAEALRVMEQSAWRTVLHDDEIIMCAGVLQMWPGRYQLNAFLWPDSGKHMLFLTRGVRKFIDGYKGRLEFTVRTDFAAGHRWAKLLGFVVETSILKAFGPQGEDHVGYVRIT